MTFWRYVLPGRLVLEASTLPASKFEWKLIILFMSECYHLSETFGRSESSFDRGFGVIGCLFVLVVCASRVILCCVFVCVPTVLVVGHPLILYIATCVCAKLSSRVMLIIRKDHPNVFSLLF